MGSQKKSSYVVLERGSATDNLGRKTIGFTERTERNYNTRLTA